MPLDEKAREYIEEATARHATKAMRDPLKQWETIKDDTREKYALYLASREWAVKRRATLKRADNICERCHLFPAKDIHHLHYRNKYQEQPEDLIALCDYCHQFNHGVTDFDPLAQTQMTGEEQDRFMFTLMTVTEFRKAVLHVLGLSSEKPRRKSRPRNWTETAVERTEL
jgi:hypothetical protein